MFVVGLELNKQTKRNFASAVSKILQQIYKNQSPRRKLQLCIILETTTRTPGRKILNSYFPPNRHKSQRAIRLWVSHFQPFLFLYVHRSPSISYSSCQQKTPWLKIVQVLKHDNFPSNQRHRSRRPHDKEKKELASLGGPRDA